jgi:hypothetical protein
MREIFTFELHSVTGGIDWTGNFSEGVKSALSGAEHGAFLGGTLGMAGGPEFIPFGAAAGAVYGAGSVILFDGD